MSPWLRCLERLEAELPAESFYTWIKPLHAEAREGGVSLLAPNAFVVETVRDEYLPRITELLRHYAEDAGLQVGLELGTPRSREREPAAAPAASAAGAVRLQASGPQGKPIASNLDPSYTFDTFIEGSSNQLGRAAALQVAKDPGKAYNPLLLYGGTGLGKTHLMHAAGNYMLARNPGMRVLYLRSEQFFAAMVKALADKAMEQFKRQFHSVHALLIDDIQFFAGKDRTQEEFFHTFNALFELKQQIILTCDRYPKEVDNLEPRLKSRLGWGLSVAIEPPDFETRAAILLAKAAQKGVPLPENVAFLIARRMRSNVRDLEGALNTLAARANFMGRAITEEFAQEALRDLLRAQQAVISLANIQKTVADYFQLRVSDLLSKRRTRSLARPRQMAMALAKELTEHSLPEIGDAFGGRDHTTVMHACKVVRALVGDDPKAREDWDKLVRRLTE
ncbi:chromosomal replication initiator protein DnaA [Aquimonas voraii]|uniref:Chromosomal replication initiator protein DnaA n=1 Tax=Aquimonas voraii TaxID=265719 RepID=A0A1G6WIP3_9GAMM|nr:chromosomal replication initiator protein DnaA [Aquimonas voraii]SDD65752.1 chromosomal replication initiator protein DnaA [Aquimonas voraii]